MRKYDITDRPIVLKCRDSLSQAIFREEEEGKKVFLDLTGLGEESWPDDNFAASERALLYKGLSCSRKPIRISPLCHFFMGGVAADQNGKTDLPGLFAAGEVMGGLHGANRMGGNALSEIIVFGSLAGRSAGEWARKAKHGKTAEARAKNQWDAFAKKLGRQEGGLSPRSIRRGIAEILWNKVGISRDERGLNSALEFFRKTREEDLPRVSTGTPKETLERLEVENALLVGEMIARSALLRKESRGAHSRKDYPGTDDQNWRGNVFLRKSSDGMCLDYRPLLG